MSIITPEIEYVDRSMESIRYLEHGWPSDLCRWHSHREFELHLIVATRGKAFVGDYIGEFRPGSLFLTGPYLPHNWVTDEITSRHVSTRDMLVQFDQESVNSLSLAFPEFDDMRPMFELACSGIEFSGFDAKLVQRRLAEIRNSSGPSRILAFLQLLVEINQHAEMRQLSVAAVTQPEDSNKHTRIASVVDHITQHFAEEISLETAAELACMSPTAFSRNFQKITGNRFLEFLNRVRVGQACSMLYATDQPVSAICYEVGFQNLANFNRHFMKMKNMTPTAYRALARVDLVKKEAAS
jgi:AraC-like DNA-binding protein|tara:strand:+ start:307 stop:1197 length:891 start_codon:yes stop_codon:yes gene_type:complete